MSKKHPTLRNALEWANNPSATDGELYLAADTLISWGKVDLAEQLIGRLKSSPRFSGRVNRLVAAARQLRRSGVLTDLAAMTESEAMDGRYEAYTARYAGETRKAIIVFTGVDPRFWLSLMMLHLFLKRLNTHVIYLTDLRRLIFFDGLATVARGYDGLLQALRKTLAELGADEVHVMANSAGGFAGLRYAIDLQAKSFLGMSIRTDLSLGSPVPVGSFFQRPQLAEIAPQMHIDLKPLLVTSGKPERVILYCGDSNPIDRPHALHIADLPNVELTMLPNHIEHDVISILVARGDFEAVLQDFVYGPPVSRRSTGT
jgi:pimeloyl-ACP methyl ester carboxylesterase